MTGKTGSPLDFVAFHAKGAPKVVNGVVRMGMNTHFRHLDQGFAIVEKHPELKGIPVIVGEGDPEGCAACGMQTNPENAYRNGTLYASYTATSVVDQDHGNSCSPWKRMGSPTRPTAAQVAALQRASELAPMTPPVTLTTRNGPATVGMQLPRQACRLSACAIEAWRRSGA